MSVHVYVCTYVVGGGAGYARRGRWSGVCRCGGPGDAKVTGRYMMELSG